MELKFKISKGDETVELYVDFDSEDESYYFYQNDKAYTNVEDLSLSEDFKTELNVWDTRQWACDSVPYDLSTRTGVRFSFDFRYFLESVKNAGLYGKWMKMENFCGSSTKLLEKGLISEESIIKAYNKLMEGYE